MELGIFAGSLTPAINITATVCVRMTGINTKFFATVLANTENRFTFTHGYSSLYVCFFKKQALQEEYLFLFKRQDETKSQDEFPGKNI